MSNRGLAVCRPGFAGWGVLRLLPTLLALGMVGPFWLSLWWTGGQTGRNPGVILQ